MLEKYDEFSQKRKALDNQKKDYQEKIKKLNREKLKTKLDQFNKQKQEIQQKMSTYVAGPSNFN